MDVTEAQEAKQLLEYQHAGAEGGSGSNCFEQSDREIRLWICLESRGGFSTHFGTVVGGIIMGVSVSWTSGRYAVASRELAQA